MAAEMLILFAAYGLVCIRVFCQCSSFTVKQIAK